MSLEMAHVTPFLYTGQLVTSMIENTSTADKPLISVGHRLGLKAAH